MAHHIILVLAVSVFGEASKGVPAYLAQMYEIEDHAESVNTFLRQKEYVLILQYLTNNRLRHITKLNTNTILLL